MVWTCLDSPDATQQFFQANLQFGEMNRSPQSSHVKVAPTSPQANRISCEDRGMLSIVVVWWDDFVSCSQHQGRWHSLHDFGNQLSATNTWSGIHAGCWKAPPVS